jgi:hypothetical protein
MRQVKLGAAFDGLLQIQRSVTECRARAHIAQADEACAKREHMVKSHLARLHCARLQHLEAEQLVGSRRLANAHWGEIGFDFNSLNSAEKSSSAPPSFITS